MKSFFYRLFLENWQRKLVSLILATIIWLLVYHSMIATRIVSQIPVRITYLSEEKTIEGMQANQILNQKVSLTLTGNKSILEEISGKDLEVVIDGSSKNSDWVEIIGKSHLVSLNPDIDPVKSISKVAPLDLPIHLTQKVSERVPVRITQPIGEAPKGYQFLDVWPYQLYLNVTGPEEAIKRLKQKGLPLTFNLNNISKTELETLRKSGSPNDELSFFVPNAWKKVSIPTLSETPFEINDPLAKVLRIDFARKDHLPIKLPLPVTVFFPSKYTHELNPKTFHIEPNEELRNQEGVFYMTLPLYAQGVSQLFLDLVKDMIQIVVIACPKSERETLLWHVQFMHPHELEDRYVAKVMFESRDEIGDVLPHLREDYLRNRFRSYMNRFRLYTTDHEKLNLHIELKENSISIHSQNAR